MWTATACAANRFEQQQAGERVVENEADNAQVRQQLRVIAVRIALAPGHNQILAVPKSDERTPLPELHRLLNHLDSRGFFLSVFPAEEALKAGE